MNLQKRKMMHMNQQTQKPKRTRMTGLNTILRRPMSPTPLGIVKVCLMLFYRTKINVFERKLNPHNFFLTGIYYRQHAIYISLNQINFSNVR